MIWRDVDEDKHYLFLNCDGQGIHKNTTFPMTLSPAPRPTAQPLVTP